MNKHKCHGCGHEWTGTRKIYKRSWLVQTTPIECPKCKDCMWNHTKEERQRMMREAVNRLDIFNARMRERNKEQT